jgi:hypothetical protein
MFWKKLLSIQLPKGWLIDTSTAIHRQGLP